MEAVFWDAGLKARLGDRRWLVGVSGGGDSVALARLLVEAGFEGLVVGCFNHGWGAFGDESAAFVERLAGELGLEVRVGQGSGKAASNAEAVARKERYAWFKDICGKDGLAGVIVAHTRDDVVEGFLMRAGKGSGLGGLAGMKVSGEVGGLRVERPLLEVGREALREHLHRLGQTWMEDPDNEAGGSQRAKVRKVIPALEAAGVTMHGLAASARALAEADEVVGAAAANFPLKATGQGVEWERSAFMEAPVELAARVLARAMQKILGEVMVVRRSKRVALWERIRAEESGVATLGGCRFEWKGGKIVARKE